MACGTVYEIAMKNQEFKKTAHARIEEIYAKYPRKMGKTVGMRKAITQCRTIEELDLLEKAVLNYINHIFREGTEKQYILYFSTFMGQWKDWLDPETGSYIANKIDLSEVGFD